MISRHSPSNSAMRIDSQSVPESMLQKVPEKRCEDCGCKMRQERIRNGEKFCELCAGKLKNILTVELDIWWWSMYETLNAASEVSPCTVSQVSKILEISDAAIRSRFYKLCDRGAMINKVCEKKNNHLWSLTEKGERKLLAMLGGAYESN